MRTFAAVLAFIVAAGLPFLAEAGRHGGTTQTMIPFITSLSPTGGTTAGGNHVTITGGHFTGTDTGCTGCGVKFGGFAAASFTVTNDTHIDAVPASHTAATVNLHVNNGNGSNPIGPQTQYTFTASGAPTITSISPTSGATAGGTVVTITGTNMTGATAALFGLISVVPSASTATTVTATSPAQVAGQYDITVTATGTSTPVTADLFTYSDFTEVLKTGGGGIGGTELRNIEWHPILNGLTLPDGTTCVHAVPGCPVLFASNGFWMDTSCSPGQGPQIFGLTTSLGTWDLDFEFPGLPSCSAVGNWVNSTHDFTVNFDGAGNAISPAPDILVASGTGPPVFARHDTFPNTVCSTPSSVNCTWPDFDWSGSGGSNRAMSHHEDDSSGAPNNHITYLIIGNTGDGMHHASFLSSPWGFTVGATPENFCQASSGTTCTSTCSPNDADSCTNLNGDWPSALPVTSVTSSGGQVTLHWGSGSALRAPLSPGYSQIQISGVTCSVGTAPSGLKLVNAATTTSATVTATGTGCANGTVTTPIIAACGTVTSCKASGGLPNKRVLGVTECNVGSGGNSAGMALFMATAMEVWQRVDKGASSFWKLKGAIPYPSAGFATGQPQIRGLSCVVDTTKSGGFALLGHIEGDGQMWSMDPNTGIFNSEANLIAILRATWGGAGGGYGIDSYNSASIVPITVSATPYYIFGLGDSAGAPATRPYINTSGGNRGWEAVSGLWIRSTLAGVPSYTPFPTLAMMPAFLNQIHTSTSSPPAFAPTGSAPFPLMVSTRSGPVVSQFDEDAGQTLFMGGFDANATSVHNTAWTARVPVNMFTWP